MTVIKKVNRITIDITLKCDCGKSFPFKEDTSKRPDEDIGVCPRCKNKYAMVIAPKTVIPAPTDGQKHVTDFFKTTHGSYV